MKISLAILCLIFLFSCGPNNMPADKTAKPPANKNWAGKWERVVWENEADLETAVKGDSIDFKLTAASGGNTGEMEGTAFINGSKARFYSADENDTCIIEFKIFGDTMISVDQLLGNCGTGMGVVYSGSYYKPGTHKKDTVENLNTLGLLNKTDDSLLKSLTGKSYDAFVSSTQMTTENDDLDSLHVRVVSCGVRGLYTEMENIIMIDSSKNIWAAVISNDTVLYFTNHKDYANKLPKSIENWRTNFKQYPVIYKYGK
jgi:hypothetical protein